VWGSADGKIVRLCVGWKAGKAKVWLVALLSAVVLSADDMSSDAIELISSMHVCLEPT